MTRHLQFKPYNLFPTLVIKIPGFLNNEQIKDALELIESYPDDSRKEMDKSINVGDLKAATSSFSYEKERDIIHEISSTIPSCKFIVQEIQQCLDEYTSAHRMKPLILTNSWFNIMDRGSILAYHVHEYSIISGAIYLKKASGISDITFKTPNPYARMLSISQNENIPGSKYAKVSAEAGDLIIFPSWLEHGTDYLSPLNDRRIVVSFNSNFIINQ
ncbi:Conserved hypothetical protein CHP02466 [uncultured Caudovirales phage]|uniref:Uncharacterized protein n=1 Tax=uncultured Caudovirales phage TaxID=2100421 RepID=A0A6J7WU92_9CAUD|nr:Conserved hypothetical protein CHP02466 [uncultured Caudovirales phage]